jgi:tRNA threonylcarbamoyladenosine biosynthesis protein TsaB
MTAPAPTPSHPLVSGIADGLGAPPLDAPATPTLLAFDTATERAYLALDAGGRTWARELDGGARASAHFLPALLGLLDEAGVALAELDAIAFGRGPGAFTGLRVACAVAQGLAFGAGKPVLPIDTLLAVAEDARADAPSLRVWAMLDARMNEIYAAEYAFDDGRWQVVTPPMLAGVEVLHERWRLTPPAAVAGNALVAFGSRLSTGAARRFEQAAPRGAAVLALARTRWRREGGVDPALALPFYLRDKVALTTVERAAKATA